MSGAPTVPDDVAIESAIAAVLAAERAAGDSIARAGLEAAQIEEDARAAARALAERTERRIRRIRAAFAAGLERELARTNAEQQLADAVHEPERAELAALRDAVEALAARLTGADDDRRG